MALFEGNYEIKFNVENFSEDRKAQFTDYIKRWEQEHPLGYDNWIENFDFNTLESELWGGNDPENIEDMHNFLIEVAKEFPELEATGNGDGEDVASGSWSTKYKFSLKDGILEWDEDTWDEEAAEEAHMQEVLEESANRPVSPDFKHSLKELLPNLKEDAPNGLKTDNGVLKEINYEEYVPYLGDVDSSIYYFPPEVTKFDWDLNDFNSPWDSVDTLIITTAMKEIEDIFFIHGFENFYIIDADTKNVVFYTDRFIFPDDVDRMVGYTLFGDFIDDYSKDQNSAIHNPVYGIAP